MSRDPFFERRRRSARQAALDVRRDPTEPRQSAASPTSMAVKVLDAATERAINDYLNEMMDGTRTTLRPT